jgi:hypothetical protein
MKQKAELIIAERIEQRIFLIRGKKVMLDRDLAELYGVTTKALNQAVKRNIKRFPGDFMFQLTEQEFKIWKSQIVTSKSAPSLRSQFVTLKRGQHAKYLPCAFTEHGILMLSSVLNSDKAIFVNIQIMRTFTKLRELIAEHKDLQQKISELEKKYDRKFNIIFEAIRKLLEPPRAKPKLPIGFHVIP